MVFTHRRIIKISCTTRYGTRAMRCTYNLITMINMNTNVNMCNEAAF